MNHADDTIAAIATPPGEGGIAVVRVSGPDAHQVARVVLALEEGTLLEPRVAHLRHAIGTRGEVLDEVLALWMPRPHSYTREDVLELQCHGGFSAARVVLEATLAGGARLAEPGEFTLRAFLNGRLDLLQAEAVVDVIRARTAESLRVHEDLLAGRLSQVVETWQQHLAHVLTFLEAHLDFADEEDVGSFAPGPSVAALGSLLSEMEERLGTFPWGRACRDGYTVAILGAPNTGKSSLLNTLLEEDRAIVSSVPGTTRDAVDGWVNALGVSVRLVDTAGLRDTSDEIEGEGVSRARAAAERADLILFVTDGSRELCAGETLELKRLAAAGKTLAVVNKIDLQRVPVRTLAEEFGAPPLEISALTGAGIPQLLHALRDRAWGGEGSGCEVPPTRKRHHQCVAAAASAVRQAIQVLEQNGFLEVAASELHGARRHLAELLGHGTAEDVLQAVFSDFCIGK